MYVYDDITKDYENVTLGERGKNKANTKPNKANLLNARMNLNFYSTKEYENISNCSLGENKPNTNPIRTQSNPTCSELVEPISKAKLQPCKLELIKRIWGYKSTIALTFARNSLILLNGDVRYSMLIASGIENLRFETACIEKGNK